MKKCQKIYYSFFKFFDSVNRPSNSQSRLKEPTMIASQIMQSYALLDSLQTIVVQKQVFKIEIYGKNILIGSQTK